jgi:hypothetical protein
MSRPDSPEKAAKQRSGPARYALLLALPIGLFLTWTQGGGEPSRAELAGAIARESGRTVPVGAVRSLGCEKVADRQGFECRWKQLEDEVWLKRSGHLHASTDGWRLDMPAGGAP